MSIPNIYFKFLSNETLTIFLYKLSLLLQLIMDRKTPLQVKTLIWSIRNNTMVNYPRLLNILYTVDEVNAKKIHGDFVECGVWKGGCSALMAMRAKETERMTYLFDSFVGLPQPTNDDGIGAVTFSGGKNEGQLASIDKNVGTMQDVITLFEKLKIVNYRIIKGWFQNTLPQNKDKIGNIAILRLDGDWYESTKVCLEYLYDNVVEGGYILVDDYNFWPGCKKAVDEFFDNRKIFPNIIKVDLSGIAIRKSN